MTTFLIYAAALLVSFIVLVVVAFVYVIMSEDDKNDQHKGASCSPASAGGKPPFRAASSLARHRVMATNPIISTPTASQTVRTLSFRSSPQVMMPAQQWEFPTATWFQKRLAAIRKGATNEKALEIMLNPDKYE